MFHFVFMFCFFLAPDQNPTGVQGFGTEHDNLVISWKVIMFHEAFTVIQGELWANELCYFYKI